MEINVALAGNPNSGKTTLFNALTGSNQFVGNWPGVTVEKKEGRYKLDKEINIVDLPGIYSLSPYTLEEVVSRTFLLEEDVDVILNIVDGTNMERNLYLTSQLLELGIPMVIAVNMADVMEKRKDKIAYALLSKELGCPVLPLSALKNQGLHDLMAEVKKAKHRPFEVKNIYDEELNHTLDLLAQCLPAHKKDKSVLFYSVKLFERDEQILRALNITNDEAAIEAMEARYDDESESIITEARYAYITSLMQTCYQRGLREKQTTSDKIDRIVTNRILALPIFALVMILVYYVSVTSVGTFMTDWTNDVLFGEIIPPAIESFLAAIGCAPWLQSLILDGMVSGVGAVLGFVPQMLVLFAFLAVLEDCGYMARIAFILDRIFRKFGLSGKSFIPMLIGTGCGVPGIMASRTIEQEQDRKMTIITTTFIPCSAKLPIIALIAGALFQGAFWVAPSAYFLGMGAVIISGILLKKGRAFAGDTAPFIMEMPAYHMPRLQNILRSMWERGFGFVKKAGTVILLSAIVIWFLQSFGFHDGSFGMVTDMEESLLAALGHGVAWIFTPLGWGNWKGAVATITGLVAKENVVQTFGQLYGFGVVAENGQEVWTTLSASFTSLSAYSFLAFNLLCAPCFAAMGAIKKEMNDRRWTLFAIAYQCGFAYVVALLIYQTGSFLQTRTFTLGTFMALVLFVGLCYLLVRKPHSKRRQHVASSLRKEVSQ